MIGQSLIYTFNRYRTLQTNVISALPVVILMPHSACNCRCVMCDIWKDNKNLKQLTEQDIAGLLNSLKKFGTREALMSGGEALLNPGFFSLCKILKQNGIKITLLSTGLTIKKNAQQILEFVDTLIVSLDGDEALHDAIRNIPNAFAKVKEGVEYIKSIKPDYRITARTVIHRLNFRNWESIINEARAMGIDQLSFLPADVSSHAFNRQMAWEQPRQHEILLSEQELPELQDVIDQVLGRKGDFATRYIAESPAKIQDVYYYYAAFYGLNPFPFKKCNAPWVSTVIEADGSVRPCFFMDTIGNIRESSLDAILNGDSAINFRKTLDMSKNESCIRCVCSLNLPPMAKPA
ncbi:radical SAM protein [Mucilaginibacter sp. L3T2-6]|nr:radical SAM protein [Mucilaginibacter sp. L3T2-6]